MTKQEIIEQLKNIKDQWAKILRERLIAIQSLKLSRILYMMWKVMMVVWIFLKNMMMNIMKTSRMWTLPN